MDWKYDNLQQMLLAFHRRTLSKLDHEQLVNHDQPIADHDCQPVAQSMSVLAESEAADE